MLGNQWHVAAKSWRAHAHVAYLSYVSCLVVCCSSSVLFVWVGGQKSRASKNMHLRKHVCSYLSYCKHPSLTQYDGNYILLIFFVERVCVCSTVCCVVPSLNIIVAPRVGEIKVFAQYSTAICCSCDGLKISWRTSMSKANKFEMPRCLLYWCNPLISHAIAHDFSWV